MKNILRIFACFTCFIYSLLMITSCSNSDDNNLVINSKVEASNENIDIAGNSERQSEAVPPAEAEYNLSGHLPKALLTKRESIDVLFGDIYPDKENMRDIIFSETDQYFGYEYYFVLEDNTLSNPWRLECYGETDDGLYFLYRVYECVYYDDYFDHTVTGNFIAFDRGTMEIIEKRFFSDETEGWEENGRYCSIFEESLKQDGISQFHPVVVGDVLIGGSYGCKWFCAYEFAQELTGEEIYKLYGLNAYVGETKGAKVVPETDQWYGPYTEFVDLGHDFADDPIIAMNGIWDGLPRNPVAQTGNNDTYKAIINGLLEDCGLYDADIEILQNYRIDFEGDGVDEVVLYAENKKTNNNDWLFDERKGCFSILVLRKIVDGSVKNYVLQCDVHPEETDPDGLNRRIRYIFPIVGFVDLNGDGKIELVSSWRYYEGTSYEVFEIFDDGVKSVVANGYGA